MMRTKKIDISFSRSRFCKKFLFSGNFFVLLAACASFPISACAPLEKNHGNLVKEYQVEQIAQGGYTKQSTLKVLGSPTTKAPFDDNVWYYIGQKSETRGIGEPEIVEQKILRVAFDENGRVNEIEEIKANPRHNLAIVDKETPTAGTDTTALQQFFGNLGRFNQPVGLGSATDDGMGGGPGGGL